MASGRIVVEGFMPALDLNGSPIPGARLTFFLNKTSSLQAVYTDPELTVPHTNPVIADVGGQFPSIFADPATTFTVDLADADGAPVGFASRDDVRSIGRPGAPSDEQVESAITGVVAPVAADAAAALALATPLASITALRAVTWTGGHPSRVTLLSSWSDDDGGGSFRWDGASVATDNHGTIIKENATTTGRWIRENQNGDVFPEWFGPVGSTTDHVAWQRAIEYVLPFLGGRVVPLGRFYSFASTVTMRSGVRVSGRGKAGWGPYNGAGTAFSDVGRTVIEVDGITAFDAGETNTARIDGVTIRGKDGGQSDYGTAPNFDALSVGIEITASSQFEADDIAFQGLYSGVQCNQTTADTTHMPSFTNWMASDCDRVFRFGTSLSSDYTIRDAFISQSVISLHCGRIVEAHWADGLRIEGSRMFQCSDMQIYVRASVYVAINDVTLFETAGRNMLLEQCETITISGFTCSRNGSYQDPFTPPFPQHTAIRLDGCSSASIQGVVRQGTGIALDLNECVGTSVDIVVDTPFWTSGSDTDAAIRIRNSACIRIDASVATTYLRETNPTSCKYALDVDEYSARTLTGNVSLPPDVGTIRGASIQGSGAYIFTMAEDMPMGGSGVLPFGTVRAFLDAGQILESRCVEIDTTTVNMRTLHNVTATGVFWTPTSTDAKGSMCLTDLVLYDNSAGAAGWCEVEVSFRNTTGSDFTVPAGTQVRISTAIT